MESTMQIINRMLLLIMFFIPSVAVSDEHVVGEWVDKVPNQFEMVIVIKKEGDNYVMHQYFDDGSHRQHRLREFITTSGFRLVLKDKDSKFGEYYGIRNNGDLSLFDSDGFIRNAKKATSRDVKKATGNCTGTWDEIKNCL